MIHNMVGGGASLNFKIVGGISQPENPAENTVWMPTDVKIPSWAFSFEEPSTAEEGMGWVCVGTSSQVAFNAVKQNCIQVYPLSAKQFVNGAWENVSAMVYQNGEWHELLSRVVYISDGAMLVEPTSTYQATIEASGGVCKISTGQGTSHWAVNFECNNHAGQTVYIEIASGEVLNTSSYTSGILVNAVETDATKGAPDYIAQTLIPTTNTNTVYELKIPDDFNSGYLTIHVEPDRNVGYYNIKNLWIE